MPDKNITANEYKPKVLHVLYQDRGIGGAQYLVRCRCSKSNRDESYILKNGRKKAKGYEIICHSIKSWIIFMLRHLRIPEKYVIHHRIKHISILEKQILVIIIRLSRKVYFVSEFQKSEYLADKIIKSDKAAIFDIKIEPPRYIKKTYEYNYRFIIYSRLEESKNIDDAINFFRGIKTKRKELTIYGIGSLEEKINNISKREINITYKGQDNDKDLSFSMSDVILIFSKDEGLGLTVIEAALRKNLIVCDKSLCKNFPELILIPYESMMQYKESEMKEIVKRNHEVAVEKYT